MNGQVNEFVTGILSVEAAENLKSHIAKGKIELNTWYWDYNVFQYKSMLVMPFKFYQHVNNQISVLFAVLTGDGTAGVEDYSLESLEGELSEKTIRFSKLEKNDIQGESWSAFLK